MAKDQKAGPAGGRKAGDARAERLRTALRDNLKRRKMQARARSRPEVTTAHDSAGFLPDKSRE
jgi:hypothetical protein